MRDINRIKQHSKIFFMNRRQILIHTYQKESILLIIIIFHNNSNSDCAEQYVKESTFLCLSGRNSLQEIYVTQILINDEDVA